MDVQLIDFALDPLEKLYGAYRTCYSADTSVEIWEKIRSEAISKERIRTFIGERLKTGHASPLEQVVFWFAIAALADSVIRPTSNQALHRKLVVHVVRPFILGSPFLAGVS